MAVLSAVAAVVLETSVDMAAAPPGGIECGGWPAGLEPATAGPSLDPLLYPIELRPPSGNRRPALVIEEPVGVDAGARAR